MSLLSRSSLLSDECFTSSLAGLVGDNLKMEFKKIMFKDITCSYLDLYRENVGML